MSAEHHQDGAEAEGRNDAAVHDDAIMLVHGRTPRVVRATQNVRLDGQ